MRDTPSLHAARALAFSHAEAFGQEHRLSTCPLYRIDEHGYPDLLGSSVLFAVGPHRFAVSAKHVLAHLSAGPLAIVASGAVILHGQSFFVTVSNESGEDRFDLAILPLTPEQVTDLGECRYLTGEDLDVDEQPNFERPAGSKYFAFGFPYRLQKRFVPGQGVAPISMVVHTLPSRSVAYHALGLDPVRHLLIDFDRRNTSAREGFRNSPKLNGMSGAGVWTAPRATERSPSRLVAILIEHHQRSVKVIVATRVRAVLGGIWKHFPDARPELVDLLLPAVGESFG